MFGAVKVFVSVSEFHSLSSGGYPSAAIALSVKLCRSDQRRQGGCSCAFSLRKEKNGVGLMWAAAVGGELEAAQAPRAAGNAQSSGHPVQHGSPRPSAIIKWYRKDNYQAFRSRCSVHRTQVARSRCWQRWSCGGRLSRLVWLGSRKAERKNNSKLRLLS